MLPNTLRAFAATVRPLSQETVVLVLVLVLVLGGHCGLAGGLSCQQENPRICTWTNVTSPSMGGHQTMSFCTALLLCPVLLLLLLLAMGLVVYQQVVAVWGPWMPTWPTPLRYQWKALGTAPNASTLINGTINSAKGVMFTVSELWEKLWPRRQQWTLRLPSLQMGGPFCIHVVRDSFFC
jgi:hypothetical protein